MSEFRSSFTDQVLLVNKPLRWTSFDVVKKIRNTSRIKKVGHAGTLDPLADGLLIVCTGKKTKDIDQIQAQTKEYTGSFTLGAVTPSYDLETEPEQHQPFQHISEAQLHQAAKSMTGVITQTPPIFSAVKKDGVRAYELARKGESVALKSREVTISAFEITHIELPIVHFRIECSKGTYIRSMANDFGQMLGCGAYLSALKRTKIGDFDLQEAWELESLIEQMKKEKEAFLDANS
jgi:tRNA pseudouridine55 synthase